MLKKKEGKRCLPPCCLFICRRTSVAPDPEAAAAAVAAARERMAEALGGARSSSSLPTLDEDHPIAGDATYLLHALIDLHQLHSISSCCAVDTMCISCFFTSADDGVMQH